MSGFITNQVEAREVDLPWACTGTSLRSTTLASLVSVHPAVAIDLGQS